MKYYCGFSETPNLTPTLTIVVNGPLYDIPVGNLLAYRLIVTNTSSTINANNVVVTDILPNALQFVSATSSQGFTSNMGNTVTANIGTLLAGSSATITIVSNTLRVGRISNSATVTSSNAGSNSSNVVVTNIIETPSTPLSIRKFVCRNVVYVGECFKYRILVTNNSSTTVNNLTITDYLPNNVSLVSVDCSDESYSECDNLVKYNIRSLAPNQSAEISIEVKAKCVGEASNYATLQADNITTITSNTVNTSILNRCNEGGEVEVCRENCRCNQCHQECRCHRCHQECRCHRPEPRCREEFRYESYEREGCRENSRYEYGENSRYDYREDYRPERNSCNSNNHEWQNYEYDRRNRRSVSIEGVNARRTRCWC